MATNSREYQREYTLKRYRRRRAWAATYLGDRCRHCGSTEGLEFDHVNVNERTIRIDKLWFVGEERFKAELEKLQLLCHPCHVAKSRANGEMQSTGRKRAVPDDQHGNGSHYYVDKCRCVLCLAWKRAYRKGLVNYRGEPPDPPAILT